MSEGCPAFINVSKVGEQQRQRGFFFSRFHPLHITSSTIPQTLLTFFVSQMNINTAGTAATILKDEIVYKRYPYHLT
jgi:hypothetical protein